VLGDMRNTGEEKIRCMTLLFQRHRVHFGWRIGRAREWEGARAGNSALPLLPLRGGASRALYSNDRESLGTWSPVSPKVRIRPDIPMLGERKESRREGGEGFTVLAERREGARGWRERGRTVRATESVAHRSAAGALMLRVYRTNFC
jgi:hypothetical protein